MQPIRGIIEISKYRVKKSLFIELIEILLKDFSRKKATIFQEKCYVSIIAYMWR